MSEFSESFHIRCDDARAVEKRLRSGKYAGLVFGPANGWLTYVPYNDSPAYQRALGKPEAFAEALCCDLGAAVLVYYFAEDHGWGASFWPAAGRGSKFAEWWDESSATESAGDILSDLSIYVATETLEPLLH